MTPATGIEQTKKRPGQYLQGLFLFLIAGVGRRDTYLDTLSIDWNVKSGNSAASFKESGKVTRYQATLTKGGVQVTSSGQGVKAVQESVAFYKYAGVCQQLRRHCDSPEVCTGADNFSSIHGNFFLQQTVYLMSQVINYDSAS